MDKEKKIYNIKLIIVSVCCFLTILLITGLTLLIELTYTKQLFDGEYDHILTSAIRIAVLIVAVILFNYFVKKKLGFNCLMNTEREKKQLPLWVVITLFALVLGLVFLISGLCGWTIKPLYEQGDKFIVRTLWVYILRTVSVVVELLFVTMMIRCFQEAMDNLVICKYPIPWGGFISLVTYGVYQLIIGINAFGVLFLFLHLIYGVIYILTNKSVSKTYGLIIIIYLL